MHRQCFFISACLTGLILSYLLNSLLLAQSTQLRGRILDETGAVIPGVNLTLQNQSTRVQQQQESDEFGRFGFPQLAPGLFTLEAKCPGFTGYLQQDIRLEVDSPLTLEIVMRISQISESLTVVGSQPLLNRADATLGHVLASEQILGLPLNSRNIADAVRLQPGVTLDGEVTGSRSDQINLTLDGINVNDQFSGTNFGETFQPVLRVTPDSIQEFRVVTSNPNADQGRSSGAQVSFITRSGTNAFHGAVYNYHRNAVTAANNFFNNRAPGDPDQDGEPGIGRPNLIRNVFGGSLGGPTLRDRAFFFINYEGRKDRSESPVVRTTPLPHLGEGRMLYQNRSGEQFELGPDRIAQIYPATGGINPAATAVFAEAARKYPANDTGLGDGFNTGGFRFNASTPLDWNALTAKLDFNLTDNQQLFIRGNYQWDLMSKESYWPDTVSPSTWNHPTGASIGHTWTIRPNLANSLRYGFTRQSFSNNGDSDETSIRFRGVYQPVHFSRGRAISFPTQNLTNDTSWILGKHTFQFGTNIRLIEARHANYFDSFDGAGINFYWWEPGCLEEPLAGTDWMYGDGQATIYSVALSSLLGRYTSFGFTYNYQADGTLRPEGTARSRQFQTREFEFYLEDSWQLGSRFTLNLGLRWGVNTPLAETSGYQVQPTRPLSEYFNTRVQSAVAGIPDNELITVDRSGPFFGRPGYYSTDWNNLAPRVSFAYSPDFTSGWLGRALGGPGQSVLRGGFAVMYDRVGTALAWAYDGNAPGFSYGVGSERTFNVTDHLGPLFTGFDQDIRSLSDEEAPPEVSFPLTVPATKPGAWRIHGSLDDSIQTPVNYNWNLSFGRDLPGGLFFEISYIGRSARDLLASRDIMQFNNLTDPDSGMDWYSAAALLYEHRISNTPVEDVPPIPFFENLFPALDWVGTPSQTAYTFVARPEVGGRNILDWTYLQQVLDGLGVHPRMFIHPQYHALTTWSTIARSNYNALTTTLRKRFQDTLTFDLNYTWSKSMDSASARQDTGLYGYGLILNALRPDDNYSVSDFDVQHIINSNWIWDLPFGDGMKWMNQLPDAAEAILGGWAFNGIFRWNSGLTGDSPFEISRWATNFNIPSWGTRIRDPRTAAHKSGEHPNFWADPLYAYNSYRDPKAGETGDRNVLRIPAFFSIDVGLRKTFRMPYLEKHRLTLSWEAFNLTNTQRLGGSDSLALGLDPAVAIEITPGFGNINRIQGIPRVMQFSLRYDF